MSSIVRWEPINDLVTLREAMDRLFEESFVRPRGMTPGGSVELPLDMYETENELVVSAALPGVKPDDIEITVTGEALSIKGSVQSESTVDRANYHRQERRFGTFARTVALPVMVQIDKAEAKFRDGVLTLTLPKAEEVKPKTIKLKAQ